MSIATVSRALHQEPNSRMSPETRRRIRLAAEQQGYRPNLLGRSLATGRSHTVSYWTVNAFATYHALVAEHVCAEAARAGYYVLINNTSNPADLLEAEGAGVGGDALGASVAGVIACDVAFPNNQYATALRSPLAPLVGMGLHHPKDGDYVSLDLYAGAVEAVRHLVATGARRIAFMITADRESDPRSLAYADVMRDCGLPLERITVARHQRAAARLDIVTYGVAKGVLPEAIFCVNDETAIGCYRGLLDLGARVPDDVRLVGCDGIQDAAFQACPITTLVAPVAEMCAKAWRYLLDRIAEPDRPVQQTTLVPKLVIRESTQPYHSTGMKLPTV